MAQGPTSPQQQRNILTPQGSNMATTPLPRYPNNTQIFAQPNAPTSMQPPPPPGGSSAYLSDPALVSDADLLLNLHSPYSTASSPAGRAPTGATASAVNPHSPTGPYPSQVSHSMGGAASMTTPGQPPHSGGSVLFGDMMIESQDIDMSALGDNMMTWLEWLPHEMVTFFDQTTGTVTAADGSLGPAPGQTPGQGERRDG